MALVVGLDIGTSSLTGAVLAGTSAKFRLIDFFTEAIPDLGAGPQGAEGGIEYVPPMSLEELIHKLFTERDLTKADVVACMESKDCVIRQFSVPFTKEDQVRRVVSFTAEEYFPAFSMDDVVLEYLKVGETNGKSQLVVAALRNELIESRLGLFKRAGVDPVALDLDATALFNAFAITKLYQADKPALLLDMGATSTKIVFVEEGKIKKIRSFRTAATILNPERMLAEPAAVRGAPAGADAREGAMESKFQELEEALLKFAAPGREDGEGGDHEFSLDAPIAILTDEDYDRMHALEAKEEAPEPSRGSGGPRYPGANVLEDRLRALKEDGAKASGVNYRDYLDRVVAEIQRTFAASEAKVELVCLTGGMSGGEEARQFLTDELGVETVHLDFGGSVPMDIDSNRAGELNRFGAVAVGLALKQLGRDQCGLDFRKGRFRYEHRFARLQLPLFLLSILCFLFFLQTAFWGYHRYMYLTDRATNFEEQLALVYKGFFEKDLTPGRNPLDAAKAQLKIWEGKGVGDVGKTLDCVEAIRDFTNVLKETKLFFRVTTMKLDFRVKSQAGATGKKATLKGYETTIDLMTKDRDAHLTIMNKFKDAKVSKYFDAQASSTPVKDEYRVMLTLTPKPTILAQLEQ